MAQQKQNKIHTPLHSRCLLQNDMGPGIGLRQLAQKRS